jgi:hypothetical protein
MSASTHEPESEPSRESKFSTALWKLGTHWKEQAEAQPKPRPGRFLLFALIVPLLYILSAGPAEVIVNLTGPSKTSITVYRWFYYPVVVLHEDTPLQKPLDAYLRFWGF